MARRYKEMGICFTGVFPAREIAEHVAYAERKGFTSAWLADDYFFRSGFTFTSLAAYLTQKVRLAISITNPYTRHPALLAMDVATLDELSRRPHHLRAWGEASVIGWSRWDYTYAGTLGRIRETKEIPRRNPSRPFVLPGQALPAPQRQPGIQASSQEDSFLYRRDGSEDAGAERGDR